MTTALLIVHLFVTLALIGVVLIQRSEGGGLGVGTSQGMGGFMSGRGTANLLTRSTAILAAMFFAAVAGPGAAQPRHDGQPHAVHPGRAAAAGRGPGGSGAPFPAGDGADAPGGSRASGRGACRAPCPAGTRRGRAGCVNPGLAGRAAAAARRHRAGPCATLRTRV